MSLKEFWKNSFVAFMLKNVLIAIVALLVLAWLTLLAVDFYTLHGRSETVPDVRGMYVEEAQSVMEQYNLHIKVVDSLYVGDRPLGAVIEQIPAAGSKVKPDRDIYLVINSKVVKQIPLPDIFETSQRQAEVTLRSVGMSVQEVQYVPSVYKDLVIAVKYRGAEIKPGTRVPDGSALTLIVGQGLGDEIVAIPSFKGMTLEQAQSSLLAAGFVLGATNYDVQPNGNQTDYVIYRQTPSVGKSAAQGSRIDFWLSTDKSLLNKSFDEEGDDEEFF